MKEAANYYRGVKVSSGMHRPGHPWGLRDCRGRKLERKNYPIGNVTEDGRIVAVSSLGYDPARLAEIHHRALERHAAKENTARTIALEVQHRPVDRERRYWIVARENAEEYERVIAEQES